jgi:hypothetical protein
MTILTEFEGGSKARRSYTREVIAMRLVSVLQWLWLALTVLFVGVFLLDWTYFIAHTICWQSTRLG